MQEEVTQKTIALSVNVGKGAARLTEQALQKAIKKFLEQRKSHTPHGKQTMRQLMKQNVGDKILVRGKRQGTGGEYVDIDFGVTVGYKQ